MAYLIKLVHVKQKQELYVEELGTQKITQFD